MNKLLAAPFVALLMAGCGEGKVVQEVQTVESVEGIRKSKELIGGQVFIVTEGGDNIKLGLVKVKIFGEQSFERIAKEANATLQERLARVDQYSDWNKFLNDCIDLTILGLHWGDEVTSDADGRFLFSPPSETFILAATSSRKLSGEKEEKYRWLVRFQRDEIEVAGLLLSNHNQVKSYSGILKSELAKLRFENKKLEAFAASREREKVREAAWQKEKAERDRKFKLERERMEAAGKLERERQKLERERQKLERERLEAAFKAEQEAEAKKQEEELLAARQRMVVAAKRLEERKKLASAVAAQQAEDKKRREAEEVAKRQAEFLSQTSLKLYRKSISDLSSLASRINLITLDLGANKITNIAPLSNLINLKSLHLNHNQIRDLKPLSVLTKLETLELLGNQIIDVVPLSKLTNLKLLDLRQNRYRQQGVFMGIPNSQILMLKKTLPNCDIKF